MPLTIRRRLVDRVRQLRKIAYFCCAALVMLAVAIVFLSVSAPASSVEIASGSTFFDAPDVLPHSGRYGEVIPRSLPGIR